MDRITTSITQHRTAIITASTFIAILGVMAVVRRQSRTPSSHRRNAIRRNAREHFTVMIQNSPYDSGRSTITVFSSGEMVFSTTIGETPLPHPEELASFLRISHEGAVRLYGQMIDAAVRNSVRYASAVRYNRLGYMDPTLEVLAYLVAEEGALRWTDSDEELPLAQWLGVTHVDIVQQRFENHFDQLRAQLAQDTEHDLELNDPAVNEVKALLYHIAEERSRRSAYLHRGISCEHCGETPIRAIRWHCLNCPDFDLCSSCKIKSSHTKTHVFAEIRIPIPVLAQPVEKLPVWYSGKTDLIQSSLTPYQRRGLAQKYAFEDAEIDALCEQFSCLVDKAVEQDATGLHAGISYRSSVTSLTSASWRPHVRPNLIFERIFSFYDNDKEGVIKFEAFVSGIAYLRGDKRFQPIDRAIRGFDFDDDGLVSRADVLRLLQARFEIHRHIIQEMVEGVESEEHAVDNDTIPSSRPISSAFRQEVGHGQERHPDNKVHDQYGDEVLYNLPNGPDGEADTTDHDPLPRLDVKSLSAHERMVLGLDTDAISRERSPYGDGLLEKAIEQGLNEVLDRIFKRVEIAHRIADETAAERSARKDEIEAFREARRASQHQKEHVSIITASEDAIDLDNALVEQSLAQGIVPTDARSLEEMEFEVKQQSLGQLLDSSGYSIRDESTESAGSVYLMDVDSPPAVEQTSQAEQSQHLVHKREQSLPNERLLDAVLALQGQQLTNYNPSEDHHVARLAAIDEVASGLRSRAGQPCLRVEEISNLVEQDRTGELVGLMRSWLEWASF